MNAASNTIDALDLSDLDNPTLAFQIDVGAFGSPNSVAVDPRPWIDEIAVAVENPVVTDPGHVVFFDTDGTLIKAVQAGALPDMVAYCPKGWHLLVANEGETRGGIDPEGTVSIIPLFFGSRWLWQDQVVEVNFRLLNDNPPAGLRLFPNAES